MGYYSAVCATLKFASKEKAKEFIGLLEGERSIGDNPFFENSDIEVIDGVYYLEMNDCYVKMNEFEKWIPWLSNWVQGTIEVTGDEAYDHWKVDLYGNGTFQGFEGSVIFKERELWVPSSAKV